MPETRTEEIDPAAAQFHGSGIRTARRVVLAAVATAILLVCSSVESDVKAEKLSSPSDGKVSTSTYTIVMQVPGKSDEIYWSLNLPKSFGIKASNLKENLPTQEGDAVSKNSKPSPLTIRKNSRIRMKNIHWVDLINNNNFKSDISKISNEENIKVDLF